MYEVGGLRSDEFRSPNAFTLLNRRVQDQAGGVQCDYGMGWIGCVPDDYVLHIPSI
jgi:hypothetical protein